MCCAAATLGIPRRETAEILRAHMPPLIAHPRNCNQRENEKSKRNE
jgi:hypothetical protein